MSSNDMVSIFLSIELQSYGCAPGEVSIVETLTLFAMLMLSDIFGPSLLEGYLPRMITQSYANN